MPDYLETDYSADNFKPALWVSTKVDSEPRSILCCESLKSGYVFGDRLVPSKEGRHVVLADFVWCKPRHEVGYAATGLKTVIKGFPDASQAAKEAFIFTRACTDAECAPRLPKLLDFLRGQETFYIVYEYIEGGSLFDRISLMDGACVAEALAFRWMSDLLHCLKGLHREGIAHMDLSPENILLDEDDHCKVIDLGMGLIVSLNTICHGLPCRGKASYMSPDLYRSKPHNPLASDVWSLGVIFYIIATGMPLYAELGDASSNALEEGHFDGLVNHYQYRGCRVPQGWMRDIIRSMVNPVASLRPSPGELLARLSLHQEMP